jgi:hypothetical protein
LREELPGMARRSGPRNMFAPAQIISAGTGANDSPNPASHPAQRIGEDFISQAIADTSKGAGPEASVAAPEPVETEHALKPLGRWW